MSNTMRESQIEAYLVKQVRAHGGDTRKVKWIGRVGCPDRVVFLRGLTLWVELKTQSGKVSPSQAREIKFLKLHDQFVFVIDSKFEVDYMIKAMLSLANGKVARH